MKGLSVLGSGLVIVACTSLFAGDLEENYKKVKTDNYLELQADYYIPHVKDREKIPVVFLAHNGGATKEGWNDFPQFLMRQGLIVVNFNWNSNMIRTNLEVESVVQYTFKKYGDIADSTRVAFIGGCRGGANMIAQLTRPKKIPCTVKTVVALSISEDSSYIDMMKAIRAEHIPVKSFYSLRDRLGPKYQALSRDFAEVLLTEPKDVISLDATPHGHELVTDPTTKDQVRKEISDWLVKHLN